MNKCLKTMLPEEVVLKKTIDLNQIINYEKI